MKPLASSEIELVGRWVSAAGQVVADDVCRRIDHLIENHLVLLGQSVDGWDTLYRDPTDGRLWERSFPESQMHGGGPPLLRMLDHDAATQKYGEIARRS